MSVSQERVCVRCGRRGVQQYQRARQDGTPAVTGEAWVCTNDSACRRRTPPPRRHPDAPRPNVY